MSDLIKTSLSLGNCALHSPPGERGVPRRGRSLPPPPPRLFLYPLTNKRTRAAGWREGRWEGAVTWRGALSPSGAAVGFGANGGGGATGRREAPIVCEGRPGRDRSSPPGPLPALPRPSAPLRGRPSRVPSRPAHSSLRPRRMEEDLAAPSTSADRTDR